MIIVHKSHYIDGNYNSLIDYSLDMNGIFLQYLAAWCNVIFLSHFGLVTPNIDSDLGYFFYLGNALSQVLCHAIITTNANLL